MKRRNWNTIRTLQDRRLQMVITFATNPDELEAFAKWYPNLFREDEDAEPQKVPLSALMEATRRFNLEESDVCSDFERHFHLAGADESGLADLCLPKVLEWNADDHGDPPADIPQQFVGKTAHAGLMVNYRGKRCLVFNINFLGDDPTIGSVFTEPPQLYSLTLVDADLVDLDY